MEDRYVLARSDTGEAISVMSDRYKVVQPAQVLGFFSDVCASQSMEMETAGVLKGGAQCWAMARSKIESTLSGSDKHQMYVLLATSFDGSLATIAQGTSVRVVCANTLAMAMRSVKGQAVRVKHNTAFDAKAIQKELGMVDFEGSWDDFIQTMRALQQVPVSRHEATEIFSNLLRPPKDRKPEQEDLHADSFSALLNGRVKAGAYAPIVDKGSDRAIRGLAELETSYYRAPGSCPGTAYGVLQGVTHYLDHERGSDSNRLSSAWFGQGAALKDQCMTMLLEKAARV
jgi:phage/plasmid-like protein (TIGR03299 family)